MRGTAFTGASVRRAVTLAAAALFALAIAFFTLFGGNLRDALSPKCEWTRAAMLEADGEWLNRAVPSEAVKIDDISGEAFVFIASEDDSSGEKCDRAILTPVSLGRVLGGMVELRGVESGERVIVKSDIALTDGCRVVLTKEITP